MFKKPDSEQESPIKVFTEINMAWLQGFCKNWKFQVYKPLFPFYAYIHMSHMKDVIWRCAENSILNIALSLPFCRFSRNDPRYLPNSLPSPSSPYFQMTSLLANQNWSLIENDVILAQSPGRPGRRWWRRRWRYGVLGCQLLDSLIKIEFTRGTRQWRWRRGYLQITQVGIYARVVGSSTLTRSK